MSQAGDRMAALQRRFVATAASEAERIERALAEGDLASVRSVAHSLAGRSAMFGFAALGAIALAADEADGGTLAERANELAAALRRIAQDD
jgi:HPt (histidine-containing phosphotransfer) domain-containing protein